MTPKLQLKASGPGFWTDHARRERNLVAYAYAREFHRTSLKTGSLLVRAYLLGHALELDLKTYLLTCGVEERHLAKKFGHRLDRLLDAAKTHGVNGLVRVSPELVDDMAAFSQVYGDKDLEYFSILHLVAPPRLPNLRRLMRPEPRQ